MVNKVKIQAEDLGEIFMAHKIELVCLCIKFIISLRTR